MFFHLWTSLHRKHLFLFCGITLIIICCWSCLCTFWCWVRWAVHAASDPGVELQPWLCPGLPLPPLLLQSHVPDAVSRPTWALPGHTNHMINSTKSQCECVCAVLLFYKGASIYLCLCLSSSFDFQFLINPLAFFHFDELVKKLLSRMPVLGIQW